MTKILELLIDIEKQNLLLPEFQREYVWNREQAKQLMVSLYKEYPIGSLLFWKTDQPPALKNFHAPERGSGTVLVILDGQQRLTTLYMLMKGKIPPYYSEKDIHFDPRELYFNLFTGEFQYYLSSKMKDNPIWLRVVDIFSTSKVDVISIAKSITENDADALDLSNKLNENLNRIRNIQNIDIPVQLVPPHASLDDAIDIFDRVNRQGTMLTDAELALTHITGKWADARREMKRKIKELEQESFYFNLKFMTRALTGVLTHHALFHYVYKVDKDELIKGWTRVSKILDYLVRLLPNIAYIHSTEDLSTTNTLIPIIVYLSLNNGTFPNEKSLKYAIYWLYLANIWARYTGQTDQKLEQDVLIVLKEMFPWKKLIDQIIDQRGRIRVKPEDLERKGVRHPLYRMTYILAKSRGAIDWFNGLSLNVKKGHTYSIESHHIFPKSILYKEFFNPKDPTTWNIVNEIANRAFITAPTNKRISNKRPEEYFPEIEEKFPGALEKQFVPMDPNLWKVKNYEDFLDARRHLIVEYLNTYLNSLVTEPEIEAAKPIEEIISMGESTLIEFKSTLQWDVKLGKKNKELRKSVLKTLVGFMNTNGGTLIVGVEDDGNIYGLEADLYLVNNSRDKFEQLIANLISEHIGPHTIELIHGRFERVEEKWVYVIDVRKALEPVFLKWGNEKRFYVRVLTSTRELDAEETLNYINTHW